MNPFIPVLAVLALLATFATVFAVGYDRRLAAGCASIALGFGVLSLPVIKTEKALVPQTVIYMWLYVLITGIMLAVCICASILESMDNVVQMVPVEPEQVFENTLDPTTAPAALSLMPVLRRLGSIRFHLPSGQEHAHA